MALSKCCIVIITVLLLLLLLSSLLLFPSSTLGVFTEHPQLKGVRVLFISIDITLAKLMYAP